MLPWGLLSSKPSPVSPPQPMASGGVVVLIFLALPNVTALFPVPDSSSPSPGSLIAAPAPSLGKTPAKAKSSTTEEPETSETLKNHIFHSQTDLGSGSQLSHDLGDSLFKPVSPGVYMGMHPSGKVQMGVGGSMGKTAWPLNALGLKHSEHGCGRYHSSEEPR